MYKRALVPLDGSPFAEMVLPFLREIAGPLDLEVILLRVVPPEPEPVLDAPPRTLLREPDPRQVDAQEYLAPLAVDLRNRGVRVSARVRVGRPAEEILAVAREAEADLIAMSTHCRTGFARFVFGSVAEAVLRNAGMPVLLLRTAEPEAGSVPTAGPSSAASAPRPAAP